MTKITLRNTSKHDEKSIRASDGDSFQIQPRATVTVDEKFGWNLPAGVEQVRSRVIPVQVEAPPKATAKGVAKG